MSAINQSIGFMKTRRFSELFALPPELGEKINPDFRNRTAFSLVCAQIIDYLTAFDPSGNEENPIWIRYFRDHWHLLDLNGYRLPKSQPLPSLAAYVATNRLTTRWVSPGPKTGWQVRRMQLV